MTEYLIFIYALIPALFISVFFIPVLLTRRAAFKVIKIFCRYDALSAKNAKNAEELGLNPPDFFERMFRLRDYKPYALRLLKKTNIVHTTGDGRLYMTEERLTENLKCKLSMTQRARHSGKT